jgi:hypothetical protein
MSMQRSRICIRPAQARAVAELLRNAPASGVFTLEQTQANGRTFLYLHDRGPLSPAVMVTQKGDVLALGPEGF